MTEELSFGEMLKLERSRLGLTQEKLADEFGNQFPGDSVTRLTISRWETGENSPSLYNLKHLVIVLGLDQKGIDAFYRAARQPPETENSLSVAPIDTSNSIAASQAPPNIDNLPFQRNPFFTGREAHLERLRKQLQETGTAAITQSISISGLGGIGKTELALEYAHRHYPNVYRAALWVNAADETLQASYASLAQTLKLDEQSEQEQELVKRIQAVKDWLQTHTNWLLIMDNADDLPLAESFLPAQPRGHVVFTTQSQIIGTTARRARHIELEKMTSEEGLLFLLQRSHVLEDETTLDTVAPYIREAALEVVELLGGLPLALDQAGAYIEGTRVSFTDYIKRYQSDRRRLLSKRGSLKSKYSKHPEPVAVTFKLSFDKACEQHPLASDILQFCAFLHPDAIPEELFQHDDSLKFDTSEFDDAIAALHRYSLIKRNTQEMTFSIHRLVQAVLIDALSPDLLNHWRVRVVLALNAAFPEADFAAPLPILAFSDRALCERLQSHVLACASLTTHELDSLLEAAYLFHTASLYLSSQGRILEEEALLEKALSIWEKQLEADHPAIARSLEDLAHVYLVNGKYEQAEPLLVRELSMWEQHLGTDEHPDLDDKLDILAFTFCNQGKYEQAELAYQRVLRIREKHLGAEHPDTARPLLSLAEVLRDQGKHEQAEALFHRSLSNFRQRLKHEQILVAPRLYPRPTKMSYVNFLHSIGRDAEAAALEVNDEPFF